MIKLIVATVATQVALGGNAVAAPNLNDIARAPDVRQTIQPYDAVHLGSNCRRFSDFHAYSRGGKPFMQRLDPVAGWYWVDRKGKAVAGLDLVNCDMISFTSRPVIAAAWRG